MYSELSRVHNLMSFLSPTMFQMTTFGDSAIRLFIVQQCKHIALREKSFICSASYLRMLGVSYITCIGSKSP